jgi:hypothetical protein
MGDFKCVHDSEGSFEIIKIFLVNDLGDLVAFSAMRGLSWE